jgi:hypothetical protein
MKWRVIINMTDEPVSKWFDTEDKANRLCRTLNMDAYHRGMGGMYGVEVSDEQH